MFQCNQLGNNLKDVVDKYKKYDDSSAGLMKWLSSSEEEARKQQSEAIAADPQTLQKQLEETKARIKPQAKAVGLTLVHLKNFVFRFVFKVFLVVHFEYF